MLDDVDEVLVVNRVVVVEDVVVEEKIVVVVRFVVVVVEVVVEVVVVSVPFFREGCTETPLGGTPQFCIVRTSIRSPKIRTPLKRRLLLFLFASVTGIST